MATVAGATTDKLFLLFLFLVVFDDFVASTRRPANGVDEIFLFANPLEKFVGFVQELIETGHSSRSLLAGPIVFSVDLIVFAHNLHTPSLKDCYFSIDGVNHDILLSSPLFAKCLFLKGGEIGTLAIDEDFLAMFEVGLVQVGSSADLAERRIVVIDAAMDAMSIFMTRQEILFDAFAARGCRTVFAGDLLSNDRRVLVGTDAAALGLDHLIGKLLGRFCRHRERM